MSSAPPGRPVPGAPLPPREVFRRFADQQRHRAPPGFRVEVFPGFTRCTPLLPDLEGFVHFTRLPESEADAAIAGQVAYFATLGRDFEWSVFDFDAPADLAARLERHGFQPDDTEAFMVYPTASHRSRPRRVGVRLERVTTSEGLGRVVALQERIWNRPLPWLARSLEEMLPQAIVYLAHDGDVAAGTGWIKFPPGSDFAGLHGGSVLPGHRGRGLYSALFDARAEEACRRGYAYIAVDAAPMSRPILLRQGFQFICETTPWRKPFAPDRGHVG